MLQHLHTSQKNNMGRNEIQFCRYCCCCCCCHTRPLKLWCCTFHCAHACFNNYYQWFAINYTLIISSTQLPIPYTVTLIIVQIKPFTEFGSNVLTTFSGFITQDRLLTLAVLHKSSPSDILGHYHCCHKS